MTSALSVDRQRGPELPDEFRLPQRRPEQESPLPPEWSEATKQLREAREALEQIFGER